MTTSLHLSRLLNLITGVGRSQEFVAEGRAIPVEPDVRHWRLRAETLGHAW